MKYSVVFSILILSACGCKRIEMRSQLLNEQKMLKDSANSISDKISGYLHKGVYDSAEAEKKQLGIVFARLTDIQSSLDNP